MTSGTCGASHDQRGSFSGVTLPVSLAEVSAAPTTPEVTRAPAALRASGAMADVGTRQTFGN